MSRKISNRKRQAAQNAGIIAVLGITLATIGVVMLKLNSAARHHASASVIRSVE